MASSPHLLIDGDVLAYRAAAGAEKIICWDGDNCFPIASLSEAKRAFDGMIEELLKSWRTGDYTVALSDASNFRKQILPSYKSNRKAKPVCYGFLKEYVEAEYKALSRPGLEGDDVLGILATSKVIIKNPYKVIVSVDKDMKTLPCTVYNADKGERTVVSRSEADYNFMKQTLTGDATDGYSGCPGVGPKKAEKILSGAEGLASMWEAVKEAYRSAGLTEADALTQARMARILRNYDYDFKAKAVIPWSIERER